ncbi:MAG: hypothetical protein AAGJ46_13195 [Planctomycetota bacterium]
MTAFLKALIATAVASSAATSHAVLVVDYEFNDPAGPFSTAVDSAGSTINAWGNDPDATLNGSGQLEVSGPLGFQFRGFTGPGAISSGSGFLRIDFASWGSNADPFFVFGLRGSGPGAGIRSWRLQFSSGDASDDDPAGRLFEVGAHSFNAGFNFLGGSIPAESSSSGTMPNGLSVIMGVDLDGDTTSVWWDPNRTGDYEILGSRENVPINSGGFTDISLIDGIQLQSNGGLFAIDRLALGTNFAEIAEVSAIPEPSLLATYTAITVGMVLARRSRSPLIE